MPAARRPTPSFEDLQPGNRAPAPGQLRLVQAFANTFWDLQRGRPEQLRSPHALAAWLRRRGLLSRDVRLDESDLRRAIAVREGIRALLYANGAAHNDADAVARSNRVAVARINRALGEACVSVRLRADGHPELAAPKRDLDGALALIASGVAIAQLEGNFVRLKACPGPDCGWAFYDSSRNLSGTWCSMSICGARVKAREYRRRRRPRAGAG